MTTIEMRLFLLTEELYKASEEIMELKNDDNYYLSEIIKNARTLTSEFTDDVNRNKYLIVESDMVCNIIPDNDVEDVFNDYDFNERLNKRDLISEALLKVACGYKIGMTIKGICILLDLIDEGLNLTEKGKSCLYTMHGGMNYKL